MADNIKVLNEFLPNAETERLGAIKVGDTLDLDTNNVLNVNESATPKAYMTNCITEIPQDIKLEISSGTLTIKAGTKIYIPDGFEQDGTTKKFNTYTFASDTIFTSYVNARRALFLTPNQELAGQSIDLEFFSGTTAPTGYTYMVWYDTTNNLVKYTTDSGSTWVSGNSFPFAVVSGDNSTSTWTSIDQVFNGAGYIGHHSFVLPGVKGLAPNGIKDNGAVSSIAAETTEVQINDLAVSSDTISGYLLIRPEGTVQLAAYTEYNTHSELTTQEKIIQYIYDTNLDYVYDTTTSAYNTYPRLPFIKVNLTDGTVTAFNIHEPLRIANIYDVNEKLTILQNAKLDASRIQYVSAVPGNPQDGVIYLIAQ